MYTVEGCNVKNFIKFACDNSGKKIELDVKEGDVVRAEFCKDPTNREGQTITYAGKVININKVCFDLDCSGQYASKIVNIEYDSLLKIGLEQ